MGIEWVSLLQSKIYSIIENEFSQDIKDKYHMTSDNFSTVGNNFSAVFPFVFIKLLPALERGQDLEGKTINAGLFTFQIDITDNVSQKRARTVAFEIVRIMKGMSFEVTSMPDFEDTKEKHRSTIRFRRLIASGDAI